MKIAGFVIKKKKGKWQIHIWWPSGSRRKTNQQKNKRTQAALAIAVVGLVLLLALQIAPPLGELLLKLLAATV